jgi:hypothetical protein
MSEQFDSSTLADKTLSQWRDKQQVLNHKRAEDERKRHRWTELTGAFVALRPGMPDTGDDQADALTFVRRLGQTGCLVRNSPDLVACPPDEIKAEEGSTKAYALMILVEAMSGRETQAVQMLQNSFQASPMQHSDVLSWLTWRLESEIMGYGVSTPSAGTTAREPNETALPAAPVSLPAAEKPPTERKSGPTEVMEPTKRACVFARLLNGRCHIRYAGKEDRLGSKGLDLIYYLLRQPNKKHELLAINRDLEADEVKTGTIETEDDEPGAGLASGYTLAEHEESEPLSEDLRRKIKMEIARLRDQAQIARENGDEEQARNLEKQIETAHKYLEQHDPKLSPEQEKIRKRLNKRLKDAYDQLEAAGLTELVNHLRNHITYKGGTYLYSEPVEWSYDPPTTF